MAANLMGAMSYRTQENLHPSGAAWALEGEGPRGRGGPGELGPEKAGALGG